MSDFRNYYEIMELAETASQQEIEKAYRDAVMQFHPDRQPVGTHPRVKKMAEEKFKQIAEAYEVLKDPEKRKQYDEQLKKFKAKQPGGPGSVSAPILRVDKNNFRFAGAGAFPPETLTVINAGGGILVGTAIVNRPWVQLSETLIDTPDYQEIEITIDTTFLLPGFNDVAEIGIDTSGGKETITVELVLDSSVPATFSAYIKLIKSHLSNWRTMTIVLIIVLTINLLYSLADFFPAKRAMEFCKIRKHEVFKLPDVRPEDIEGNWGGYLFSYKDVYLSLVSHANQFEGKIFFYGIVGKIKGKISKKGKVVFQIENWEDLFADMAIRPPGFSEFLSGSFIGRLAGNKIESIGEPQFSFEKMDNAFNPYLAMTGLLSSSESAKNFSIPNVIYNLDFDKIWTTALEILKKEKEEIRFQDKEQKIIITCLTNHSSLLGDYAHKYVIAFREEMKATCVIAKLFRYEKKLGQADFSAASDPVYATDVYFFIPLEKELRKKSGKNYFGIQRQYSRKAFLSEGIDAVLDLLSIPKTLLLDHSSK